MADAHPNLGCIRHPVRRSLQGLQGNKGTPPALHFAGAHLMQRQQVLEHVAEILKRKIIVETEIWTDERRGSTFQALGLQQQARNVADKAWRKNTVLGSPEPEPAGERLAHKRARLLRNLSAWRIHRGLAPLEDAVLSSAPRHGEHGTADASSQPAACSLQAAAMQLVRSLHAAAMQPPQQPPPHPPPQPPQQATQQPRGVHTILPTVLLNTRVAKCLGTLRVAELIGVEMLEELSSVYVLPSGALSALEERWSSIAEVQTSGAAAAVGEYEYDIAAIFQTYMVALIHAGLACVALEKESERREAQKAGSTTKIKLRPALGGRYDLRRVDDKWQLLEVWGSILGSNPKTGCWQEEVCFRDPKAGRLYPPFPDELKAKTCTNTTFEALILGEALDLLQMEIKQLVSTGQELAPEAVLDKLSKKGLAGCARATLFWLSKYDVGCPMGNTALASLYNKWNTRTGQVPWILERRRAHLLQVSLTHTHTTHTPTGAPPTHQFTHHSHTTLTPLSHHSHAVQDATYIDLIVVVGEDCNEPWKMYKALGFSSFYDMFNYNLGHPNSLGEALRRQLGIAPVAGVWSAESLSHGHLAMLLAAATRQLKPLEPMTPKALEWHRCIAIQSR